MPGHLHHRPSRRRCHRPSPRRYVRTRRLRRRTPPGEALPRPSRCRRHQCYYPSTARSRRLTPQVCENPALTEVNSPWGGVARPSVFTPPAGNWAVSPQPAGVVPSGAEKDKHPRGRRGLACPAITTPTDDRAVGPYSACVGAPGADGDELPLGWGGLAFIITAPTFDGASVLTPQVWLPSYCPPALTKVNSPWGGVDSP